MAFIKDNSIINNNTIETLHNDWCRKNGYPVRWIILLTGCSAKFDNFDPTTSSLKWIITKDKK